MSSGLYIFLDIFGSLVYDSFGFIGQILEFIGHFSLYRTHLIYQTFQLFVYLAPIMTNAHILRIDFLWREGVSVGNEGSNKLTHI